MLKNLISLLIIFSVLISDGAWCIRPKPSQSIEDSERHHLPSSTPSIPISHKAEDSNPPDSATAVSLREMSVFLTMGSSAETQRLLPEPSPGSHSIHMDDETENEEEGEGLNSLELSFDTREESLGYGSIQDSLPPTRQNQILSPVSLPKGLVSHPFCNLSSLTIEDVPSLYPTVLELLSTVQGLQDGDLYQQKTARFLLKTYDPIVEGRLLHRQLIAGGLGGLAIAIGVCYSTIWLYVDLVTRLSSLEGVSTTIQTSLYYDDVIGDYVQWVLLADAGIRNAKTLSQLTAPSFSEFQEKRPLSYKIFFKSLELAVYTASCPAGAFLSYALSKAMFDRSDYSVGGPPLYSVILSFTPLALALFADDVLYFGTRLSNFLKNKFQDLYVHREDIKSLHAEKIRGKLIEEFKELEYFFLHLSEESLGQAFREILVSPSSFQMVDTSLSLSKAAESLRILRTLHHYHENDPERHLPSTSSLLHHFKKIPAWGLPLLATWGRSFIFYYIVNDVLEDIGLANDPLRMVLSIVVGGQVASLVQLKFEEQGIMHAFNKIFGNKEVQSRSSSVKTRFLSAGITLHSYFCGLWMTTPYAIVGIYATQGWGLGTRIACLIPTLLTAALGNSMAMEESSRDLSNFLHVLDLTAHPSCVSQQRNKLVTLAKSYRNIFETLDSELILRLNSLLTQGNLSVLSQNREYLDENGPLSVSRFLAQTLQLDQPQEVFGKKARRFLSYAQEFLTENKKASAQIIISSAAAVIIAVMGGGNYYNAFYLDEESDSTFLFITNPLQIDYFVPLLWLDALSRNMSVICKSLSPSTLEFEHPLGKIKRGTLILRKTLTYASACLPCLVPVVCYGRFDEWFTQFESDGLSLFDFFTTTPFVFMNALSFYGPHLSRYVEALPKWIVPPHYSLGSSAEQTRGRVVREFKNLKWWVAGLKEGDIHELYDKVLGSSLDELPATSEDRENFLAAKALRTLWVLRQYSIQNQAMMPDPEPEIARKALSKSMSWILPLVASGGRTFIYWYMFYHLFEFLGLENDAANMALSVVLGGVGSLFQGLVESEATEKAIYDLSGGKKIGEDTSHSLKRRVLRIGGKVHNLVMGAVYSIPFIGIGLLATEDWALWQRLCLLAPAVLSDTLKNMMMFNESIGGAAQFVDNTAAKLTSPSAGQKRNQLVALTRRYRQMFKRLHRDILMRLDEMLESVNEDKNDFDNFDAKFLPSDY